MAPPPSWSVLGLAHIAGVATALSVLSNDAPDVNFDPIQSYLIESAGSPGDFLQLDSGLGAWLARDVIDARGEWRIIERSKGIFILQSVHAKMYLNVEEEGAAAALFRTSSNAMALASQWRIEQAKDGSFTIESVAQKGQYLSSGNPSTTTLPTAWERAKAQVPLTLSTDVRSSRSTKWRITQRICASHDECSVSAFCSIYGPCKRCDECHSLEDGLHGTCGECSVPIQAAPAKEDAGEIIRKAMAKRWDQEIRDLADALVHSERRAKEKEYQRAIAARAERQAASASASDEKRKARAERQAASAAAYDESRQAWNVSQRPSQRMRSRRHRSGADTGP